MSEADWWLCPHCQSLNNLSARTCYSCRKHKTRDALRASQYLNYQPVVSWDGKVSLQTRLPEMTHVQAEALRRPAPLREPPRRSILEVAPRLPGGARIAYSIDPTSGVTAVRRPIEEQAAPMAAVPVRPDPATLPIRAETAAIPVQPGSSAGQDRQFLPGVPHEEPPPGRPVAPPSAVQPPPGVPPPAPVGPQLNGRDIPWSHWHQLLDVPHPDAARLRRGLSGTGTGSGSTMDPWGRPRSSLNEAMRAERFGRGGDPRAAAEWPQADLKDRREPQEA